MANFNEIKRQLEIVDVVEKYTELKATSHGNYIGLCPLHAEKTPSFHVDRDKGLFYCHGCLEESELIWTQNGLVPIKDVEIGDTVLDIYGDTQVVTDVRKKQDTTLDIALSSYGEGIRLTRDHVCTVVKEKDAIKYISKLSRSGKNGPVRFRSSSVRYKSKESNPPITMLEARDLQVGDFFLYPVIDVNKRSNADLRNQKQASSKDALVGLPVNQETTWLYGLWLSQGYVAQGKICWELNITQEIAVEAIQQTVNKWFGIKTETSEDVQKNTTTVNLNSQTLTDLFAENFMSNGNEKSVPLASLYWTTDVQASFVEGFLNKGQILYERKPTKISSENLSAAIYALSVQSGMTPLLSKNVYEYDFYRKEKSSLSGFYYSINGILYYMSRVNSIDDSNEESVNVIDLTVTGSQTFLTKLGAVHNCQAGGDVLTFIHRKENISFGELPHYLKEYYGIEVEPDKPEEDAEKTIQLRVLKHFCKYFQERDQGRAEGYVKSRIKRYENTYEYGHFFVDKEGAEKFLEVLVGYGEHYVKAAIDLGIFYKKDNGEMFSPYENRVVFPMHRYGVIYALNGRVVGESKSNKKYLLSRKGKVYTKKNFVYGLDYAREVAKKKDVGYVFVTEGVLDTIALLEAGIPAVCTLGARVSTAQFYAMLKVFDTLYLTFDKDTAGNSGTEISIFKAFEESIVLSGYVVNLPEGKDATDYINEHSDNPESIFKLNKIPFEDKIINHYIRLTKRSLADQNDIEFLKRRMLTRICTNLYDYKTNEFSKSLIMRMADRMSYQPTFIFSLIDGSINAAQRYTVDAVGKASSETFSLVVDIAELRLLRLVHTFPALYQDIQQRSWYPSLTDAARDLLDIIAESDANPKVSTVELINRKVRADKGRYKSYVQVLATAIYKLDKNFNWEKELATLQLVFNSKYEKNSNKRLMKQVRSMHKKIATSPYKKARGKLFKKYDKNEEDKVI